MVITGKNRTSLQAVISLARHYPTAIRGADIFQEQGVSISYLEDLFTVLRRRNIVIGDRGPGGGYRLTRDPSTISVAEIIEALDREQPEYKDNDTGRALALLDSFQSSLLKDITLGALIS